MMFSQSVTVVTYPLVLVRGRMVPDPGGEAARRVIRGCLVMPGASKRLSDLGRDVREIRYSVLAPGYAHIGARALIEVEGHVYQVESVHRLSTGRALDLQEVALVDWQG